MNGWRLSRRTMLKGVGAAVSLPLLEVMESPASRAANVPAQSVRACYLYIPNGVAHGAWGADEVGPNGDILALNKWMKPFDAFKQDLIIPRKMWTPRGNGHGAGTATWLTGGGYSGRDISAGGVSADQIAAKAVGKATLLPSLELSMKGEGFFSNSLVRNTISWSEAGPVPRDIEPRVIFDRMFRSGAGGMSDRSVLDQVLEEARTLRRRTSDSDKQKIDEYLESIRAVERRIDFADRQSERAAKNPQLSRSLVRPSSGIPEDHGEYMRTMFDMITLAFWADATRVCTFMLDHGQSNRYFNFVDGVQGTWHALSHWRDASGNTEDDDGVTSWASPKQKRDQYNRVTRWHNEQVAYFLGRLKQITEPNGGTLLDNSMVLYGSSLADGHAHAERNLPLLLAGRGGGTIDSGRQVTYRQDVSMSGLHLGMLQRLGVRIDQFAESDSPMSELNG